MMNLIFSIAEVDPAGQIVAFRDGASCLRHGGKRAEDFTGDKITAEPDHKDTKWQEDQGGSHDDPQDGIRLGTGDDAAYPKIAVAFHGLAEIIDIPVPICSFGLLYLIHDKGRCALKERRNPAIEQITVSVING